MPDEESHRTVKRAREEGALIDAAKEGIYIPPWRRKKPSEIDDKSSEEFQRMYWDALRKAIKGCLNKVSLGNVKFIVVELMGENLIRGRGIFCKTIMQAQAANPGMTAVFTAVVAVVNSKLPEVGELLLVRVLKTWMTAYRRNAKDITLRLTRFVAHLTNQNVAQEAIALEMLGLLLEKPTDDSVEVAIALTKDIGKRLTEDNSGLMVLDRFKAILTEARGLQLRTQYMIEALFALWKRKFEGYDSIPEGCDLVFEDDQIPHSIGLQEVGTADLKREEDRFKVDKNFLANEEEYGKIKEEILGQDGDSDEEEAAYSSSDNEAPGAEDGLEAMDERNMVALRKQIYLTIQSSLDFEECAHKILKSPIPLESHENEVVAMIVECCANQNIYTRFFGLLAQRFCMLQRVYQDAFDEAFKTQYSVVHRLETNKLRNVGKLFAHLLFTDALPWYCLHFIHLSEERTTASSRIFIKVLFLELSEQMGLQKLNQRLNDQSLTKGFDSLFPKDNPHMARFAINFWTSIGLGALTSGLRADLQEMLEAQAQAPEPEPLPQWPESDSDSDSSSSSSSDSDSDSDSSDSDSSSDSSDSDSSSS